MKLQIEIQDVVDSKNNIQEAPHKKMAEEVIRDGGSVSFTQNGIPIGEVTTNEALAEFFGKYYGF